MSAKALFFMLSSVLTVSSNVLQCYGVDNGTGNITATTTNAAINRKTGINYGTLGINYGTLGDDLPSPYRSIQLIQSMNFSYVKLYSAEPEILKLLAGTHPRVSIMVQNDEIPLLATNASMADWWLQKNFLPYYPATRIRQIMVGNKVLSSYNSSQWNGLVPAMRFIRNSLRKRDIHNVKVGSPLGMYILNSTFPPSNGTFRQDLLPIIASLLYFLNSTDAFFYLDVSPYFAWAASHMQISLDFALFRGGHLTYMDPGSGLLYTNLLDQQIDSVIFAMQKIGFRNVRIALGETGWPSGGDVDETAANLYNAATYNRNLVRKATANPPFGTPARPGAWIPTFLYSLYDENLVDGPGTSRHWGLLRPDGTPKYQIDISGKQYRYGDALPAADNNTPYSGPIWCVVSRSANVSQLTAAVRWACGKLNGTCEYALSPGKGCYEPVSVVWHASYAFSAYWARFRNSGAHCYFSGLATQTTRNPGHETCQFPSVFV